MIGVLNILYNRPQYYKQVLDGLRPQIHKGIQYFCYIDGPRTPQEKTPVRVNELLAIDFAKKQFNGTVVVREKNFGCDLNIMTAVDEVIQFVDSLIIIEEDIVPCKGFMDWMEWGLENLVSTGQCQSVLAFSTPPDKNQDPSAYQFANWFTPWGWATTKDAWNDVFHSWVDVVKEVGIVEAQKKLLDGGKSRHVTYAKDGTPVNFPGGWDYFCNMTYEKYGLLEAVPKVPRSFNIGQVGFHQDGITKYPELEPRECTSNDFDLVKDFHEG